MTKDPCVSKRPYKFTTPDTEYRYYFLPATSLELLVPGHGHCTRKLGIEKCGGKPARIRAPIRDNLHPPPAFGHPRPGTSKGRDRAMSPV